MSTIYILLSLILLLQFIILFIILKPYLAIRAEKMEDDELLEEVAKHVIKNQIASTSYIQRKFAIGYGRASRIIEMLEQKGVIGPAKGSASREILKKNYE